jgi:glycosyltransferase involved in cell wall biosynthesis
LKYTLAKKVLLTHPGTQYSHALARQLHRQQLLGGFATGLAFGDGYRWPLPGNLRRRKVPGIPDVLIHRQPFTEGMAWLRQRNESQRVETLLFERNRLFQQRVPNKCLAACDAVIGFDTSSWLLIERAHRHKKPFVLDGSIAHPALKEKIYANLRSEFPDWAGQMRPKPSWMVEVEQRELEDADQIVVATSFTRNSYLDAGIDTEKIFVNPYGTDLDFFPSKWDGPSVSISQEKVQFVFMGTISARKGIPWLLRVWRNHPDLHKKATLSLAGYGHIPSGITLPAGVNIEGFILPQQRNAYLHRADVFVFPSYFEGFAQVIIEAMACGLPVIATPHTAAPEVMRDGESGFIINPGDDEALANALRHFTEHRNAIETMGRNARLDVLPFTWEAYGARWGQILNTL